MATTWSELYSKMVLKAKERKEFIATSFELTARCNMQCKMCYVRHPAYDKETIAKELTTAQWLRLAEEARDAGLLFLTLTGGEVLLREDFKILYEKLSKLGLIIKILTNGTLITPEFVDWLALIPPKLVSITLYGASRETYKNITGFADGYDKTVSAIDNLLEKGIPTEIKTTVVQGNKHEYDQIHDFALQRTGVLGVVNYISPARENCNSDPRGNRLSPEELFRYERHMTEKFHLLSNEKDKSESSRLDDVMADIQPNKPAETRQVKESAYPFHCTVGLCTGWVTWDGHLIPCGLLDEPVTYPLINGFKGAWEELKQKCALIPKCRECRECAYRTFCERCPARLYRETGRYDKPAPYLCELARKRTEYEKTKKQA
jgi:radical SAM protein with 4Fe4S-binding SPASM domain